MLHAPACLQGWSTAAYRSRCQPLPLRMWQPSSTQSSKLQRLQRTPRLRRTPARRPSLPAPRQGRRRAAKLGDSLLLGHCFPAMPPHGPPSSLAAAYAALSARQWRVCATLASLEMVAMPTTSCPPHARALCLVLDLTQGAKGAAKGGKGTPVMEPVAEAGLQTGRLRIVLPLHALPAHRDWLRNGA